jgi:hypothetical protein
MGDPSADASGHTADSWHAEVAAEQMRRAMTMARRQPHSGISDPSSA